MKTILIVDRKVYPRIPLNILGEIGGRVEIFEIDDDMRFNNFENISKALLYRYLDGNNIMILSGEPALLTMLSRQHIRWSLIVDHGGFYEII